MKRILYTLTAVCLLMAATGCQDEVSDIGSSIVSGEVAIAVDTITADLDGTAEWLDNIDSRATSSWDVSPFPSTARFPARSWPR